MRNTSVLLLPNISRLGRDRDTKFGTDVSSKMFLNTAKCKDSAVFDLLRENQQGLLGGVNLTPPPPHPSYG